MIFHGVLVLFAWFVVVALANSEKCSTREKGRDQYDIYLSVGKSKTPWPIFRLLLTQCWGGAWWRKYIKSESQLTLWKQQPPRPLRQLSSTRAKNYSRCTLFFFSCVDFFPSFFFGNAYILPNLLPASQTSSNVKTFNKTSLNMSLELSIEFGTSVSPCKKNPFEREHGSKTAQRQHRGLLGLFQKYKKRSIPRLV